MKLNMIAVSITVLISVVLPYLLLLYYGKYDTRKLTKIFNEEVKVNNLNIVVKEQWDLNYIGLDSVKQKLLFVQMIEKRAFVYMMNLDGLISVQLEKIMEKPANRKLKEFLAEVNIILNYNNGKEEKVSLFNAVNDYYESNEIERAERWVKEIAAHVKDYRPLKRAA